MSDNIFKFLKMCLFRFWFLKTGSDWKLEFSVRELVTVGITLILNKHPAGDDCCSILVFFLRLIPQKKEKFYTDPVYPLFMFNYVEYLFVLALMRNVCYTFTLSSPAGFGWAGFSRVLSLSHISFTSEITLFKLLATLKRANLWWRVTRRYWSQRRENSTKSFCHKNLGGWRGSIHPFIF